MIVLPNTPPCPIPLQELSATLTPQLLALRATIGASAPANRTECVRYVMKLQEYVDGIFDGLVSAENSREIAVLALAAQNTTLTAAVPWTNLRPEKMKGSEWSLANEILVAVVAAAFMYIRLGAELSNELIEDSDTADLDLKWRAVLAYYKSALGLCLFGAQFRSVCADENALLCLRVFILLDQVCNIGIQMLLLCKALWLNRISFSDSDSFDSSTNGVLCRVAIWVLEEIQNCLNVSRDLQSLLKDAKAFHLNNSGWLVYLLVLEKYAASYAALFLSIEYYQKDKIGHALGLVNYGLLSIQSKNSSTGKPSKVHLVSRIKNKIAGKRDERYISNLQSITSLRIDKSVFLDLSGVVLNDLNYLFDQLVLFHLKLTKENDNIKFDTVVDWQEVHTDSKWPLGCKIPVSTVPDYVPRALLELQGLESSSQRQYF